MISAANAVEKKRERKINNKKISKEWNEEDFNELKVCYERLKEEKCDKIVDSLKKCLKENRKKSDIILKLLEQKIITSKSELYSKRKVKVNENGLNIKSAEFVRSSDSDETSSSISEANISTEKMIQSPKEYNSSTNELIHNETSSSSFKEHNSSTNELKHNESSSSSLKEAEKMIQSSEDEISTKKRNIDTSLTNLTKPKRQRLVSSDEN